MSHGMQDLDMAWLMYLSKDSEGRRKMAGDMANTTGCLTMIIAIAIAIAIVFGLRGGF